MTKKQKLELTWIEKEQPGPGLEPRIRIGLPTEPDREDAPVRAHEALLEICAGPRCDCLSIRFRWLPVSGDTEAVASAGPRQFWFDLNERSVQLTAELEHDSTSLRLAEIVRTELTDADQQRLRQWFLEAKLILIQTTPLSKIDITNLPPADGGRMVGFIDVFPCGLALNFTLDNEAWAVDEQYCVQPNCKCKDTVLSFLKLKDAAGQVAKSIRHPPALRYNYGSQVAEPANNPPGSPSLDALLAALKREHVTLNTQLKLRHTILQGLYIRHYLELTKSRLTSLTPAQLSAPRKVGRNEPCPCGSGRKYKHCCLKETQR
ncbi:MAG: SEC-C domain-containing protein [Verrucomicrobiales bacterium]|nr:SEC-C domain-containing protein [Verrucomicrobiales bacterium]